ncbi:MAG: hypothetical protein IJ814_06190, partial [Paludibacteraceae bacterium]|nr:hypothetical protein [Paludibacteraceae bacterium]
MKKKLLFIGAALLSICNAFAVVTWDGTTQSWTQGAGTQSNPYLIETPQQLAYLADMVYAGVSKYQGVYFKHTEDFDMNGKNWVTSGTKTNYFSGVYDGNNKTIQNIVLQLTSDIKYLGLFAYTTDATIQNVKLKIKSYKAYNSMTVDYAVGCYVGGICGYMANGTIQNCEVSAHSDSISMAWPYMYFGGLVGYFESSTMDQCSNNVIYGCGSYYGGGLVGATYGTKNAKTYITNSRNTKRFSNTRTYSYDANLPQAISVGGAVGMTGDYTEMNNVHSSGIYSSTTVTNGSKVPQIKIGGLVGYGVGRNGRLKLTQCSNNGEIYFSGTGYQTIVGGLVGESSGGTITACSHRGNIVIQSAYYVGGLWAYSYNTTPTISSSYCVGDIKPIDSSTNQNSSCYAIGGINTNSGNIKNCYFAGKIQRNSQNKYAIAQKGSITNCYYLSGGGGSGVDGTTARDASAMKSASFPAMLNQDGAATFYMDLGNVNSGYPVLEYDKVNVYTITWKNDNGTTLETDTEVREGTTPTYDGAIPTKASTSQYTYTFKGWTPTIVAANANATYTATFEATKTSGNNGGKLTGRFSISEDTQVQFAQGNLQYYAASGSHQCADGTTQPGLWRLAEHQYDMIGANNKNASSSYTGWIDLFCWGTSGWNSGATAYQPWSINKITSDYLNQDLSGEYANADWGVYNAIINGGNTAGTWRTLTHSEWSYLLSERPNANYKKAVATVDGIEGMVLLPDNWTLPSGVTFTIGYGSSTSLESYRGINDYTLAQWTIMENAGAIFLPHAGLRFEASYSREVYECYQTSTNGAAETNSMVSCSGNGLGVNNLRKYKTYAVAVRLAQNVAKYTITFKNYNNSILEQYLLTEGFMPKYTGATPTKPANAQYTYTFKGWKPAIKAVTGDAVYVAEFDSIVNKYTITFLNEDGTTIESKQWNYGVTPTCKEPTKANTAEYTYTFAGWTPEVVSVTGNATYKATFNATKNSYTITWQNEDGSLIDQTTVEYGIVPTHADPVKQSTAEYTYTFAGWTPAVVAVTGNATYRATFNATKNSYTITWQNEDGSLIDQTTVEYGIVPTHANPTKANTAEYTYTFAGWTPE